jgi:hypothetical protein
MGDVHAVELVLALHGQGTPGFRIGNYDTRGALPVVEFVAPGGLAASSGVQRGDVIVAIGDNGARIGPYRGRHDYERLMSALQAWPLLLRVERRVASLPHAASPGARGGGGALAAETSSPPYGATAGRVESPAGGPAAGSSLSSRVARSRGGGPETRSLLAGDATNWSGGDSQSHALSSPTPRRRSWWPGVAPVVRAGGELAMHDLGHERRLRANCDSKALGGDASDLALDISSGAFAVETMRRSSSGRFPMPKQINLMRTSRAVSTARVAHSHSLTGLRRRARGGRWGVEWSAVECNGMEWNVTATAPPFPPSHRSLNAPPPPPLLPTISPLAATRRTFETIRSKRSSTGQHRRTTRGPTPAWTASHALRSRRRR